MTDNEIKKALECCAKLTCSECPYYEKRHIHCRELRKFALDLINRKNAENERLQADNVKLHTIIPKMLVEAKSEAIKEFWKKFDKVLCENIGPSKRVYWKISSDGDNLVKEMTEVSEDAKN